jgi:hypothetical protein
MFIDSDVVDKSRRRMYILSGIDFVHALLLILHQLHQDHQNRGYQSQHLRSQLEILAHHFQ